MAEDHDERAKHGEEHRGEEEGAMLEFAVEIRGKRHGGCDHQQIDGGDPLHSGGVHVELTHELWEQHRHHGFGKNTDEGERADRHDGADEFTADPLIIRVRAECGALLPCVAFSALSSFTGSVVPLACMFRPMLCSIVDSTPL